MPYPSTVRRCTAASELLPADAWQRLGLIALSTDLTTERDYRLLLPSEGLALYTTRVAFENPTTPDNLQLMAPRLTAAAALLPDDYPMAAICYSCTAASVVIGDAAVTDAIQMSFPGTPVVTPSLSAVYAFASLGVKRISVLTPYTLQTSEPMARYFQKHGLEILSFQCLGLEDDREMARVAPESIIKATAAVNDADSEALFISCTALPAVPVIDEIEQLLGKPVVTSNQATAWMLLQHAGITKAPQGYGHLFTRHAGIAN